MDSRHLFKISNHTTTSSDPVKITLQTFLEKIISKEEKIIELERDSKPLNEFEQNEEIFQKGFVNLFFKGYRIPYHGSINQDLLKI